MAHGGVWLKKQIMFIIVMKCCTDYSWKEVAELFRGRFGTPTTAKDCESKFNKDLKNSVEKELVDQWMGTSTFPPNDFGLHFIVDVILLIDEVPFGRRLI